MCLLRTCFYVMRAIDMPFTYLLTYLQASIGVLSGIAVSQDSSTVRTVMWRTNRRTSSDLY